MRKQLSEMTLSEMTLEELWELFPIILTEHQACWHDWYLEEAQRIQAFLPMPEMKLSLWKQYEHNRDGYTEAKGAFIRKYTEEAKREYGERYSENGGGK